jgi:hypothetical protein
MYSIHFRPVACFVTRGGRISFPSPQIFTCHAKPNRRTHTNRRDDIPNTYGEDDDNDGRSGGGSEHSEDETEHLLEPL